MENSFDLKKNSIKGFLWRAFQNVSTQLMSFIIQIILARLLLPSDYGIIALTSTFVTILNVVVSTGFSSAIVQRKNVTFVDESTMFYASFFIGIVLYSILFFASPLLANFYKNDLLVEVFRVQGISLVLASLMSVPNAIIIRRLDFAKTFIASFIAIICQGIVGITMALNGFGVWALVIGTLVSNSINCILIFVLCRWYPRFIFSFESLRTMLSFSSKVLAGDLLNSVYNSAKTLIIGRVYDLDTVGYYNKGYQFPTTLMFGIDGAMTSVLFSSLSKIQDDSVRFVAYLRRSIKLSLTVVVPLLCGMAAVADPMIRLLLTDKWEGAIPFVMITCAICLTWPLSARAQALNALGKSGTNLMINLIVKGIGFGLLIASIPFGVYVMCLSSIISAMISVVVYSIVMSKIFNYPLKQQLLDILPIYLIGFTMFGIVYLISFILTINLVLKLIVLVIIGILIYVGLSLLFKLEGFNYILNYAKSILKRRSVNSEQ